jgi:glycosyltransferase involved in cell wall biosynthesis
MARAGRARALAHFSWQAIAQQTKALYEKLLAQKKPPGAGK